MLEIKIDANSPNPIYRQIVEQISNLIAGGRLKHGEQIPSVRDLASWLQLNPSTVARAYYDLKQAGLVVTSRRQGTIVTGYKQAQEQYKKPFGWPERHHLLETLTPCADQGEIETAFTLQPSYWRVQRPG
jgi:DNA-binding transcriptional regulator YhcF (GntR family)